MAENILMFRSLAANDVNSRARMRLYRDGEQIPLELDESHIAVVAPMDCVTGYLFIDLIMELKPALVMDIRKFRTFDFEGTGSYAPRRVLAEAGAAYFWHVIEPSELPGFGDSENLVEAWKEALSEIPQAKRKGPWLILTHQQKHARVAARYLDAELKTSGESWEVDCFQS